MQERRRSPRLKQKNRAYVTVLSSPDDKNLENKTYSCSTEDVSAGGIRLSLPAALPVGSNMEMRVVSKKPVKTFWHVGRVVWSGRGRDGNIDVGIEFTQTPESTLKLWQELIREKLARK